MIKDRGMGKDPDTSNVDKVIDVGGMTVTPGLIVSHGHTVIGGYTPSQRQLDLLETYIHGGITSVISMGEVYVPGRPRDAAGVKALWRFNPGSAEITILPYAVEVRGENDR